MKIFYPCALIASLCWLLNSCAVSAPAAHSFEKTRAFAPGTSFKVMTLTDDLIANKLSHQLMLNGYTVIADNFLRSNIHTGNTIITTKDTTYQIPDYQPLVMRFSEEHEADYFIKYQSRPERASRRVNYIAFNVIDAKTGQTAASFIFPHAALEMSHIYIDQAIANFISGLKK